MGLYSVHLPLDSHPEVGNCALLARRLGIDLKGRFGAFQGTEIGWWGTVDTPREAFGELIERVVGGPVRLIPGGKEHVDRVGVVTGGGGSLLGQAVAAGLDTYVTGEASHHTFLDATEERVNVYLAGHYATETLGVQALAEHLAQSFGLTWEFIDLPSGL
jgi:dinuclear metal center YbgI/SA1388 family protein